MTFAPGEIVECINDNWEYHELNRPDTAPKKGSFYTVLSCVPHRYIPNDIGVEVQGYLNWFWEGSHFRSLKESITSTSVKHKELEPA